MSKFLSFKEVCEAIHLSRARVNQMRFGTKTIKPDPTFPAPHKLHPGKGGRVIWPEETINTWLAKHAPK
jgi:predicted DNA-binding transcriptional regulator AlpA